MIGVIVIKEKLNFNLKLYSAAAVSILIFSILIAKPAICMLGVKHGLSICAGQIIPALFPFCVLSAFLVESDIISLFSKYLSPFMKLFSLPEKCCAAVLLSFTGGYPVGAVTANSLYEQGDITRDEYKRMLLFCVNAGPAFVIGTVGSAIFKSTRAGIILFSSLTVSAIITGILSGFIKKEEAKVSRKQEKSLNSLNEAFVKSVSSATNTTLNICAWIVLFSCILEFIESLELSKAFKDFLICASEVTRGCAVSTEYKNLPLTAFILGFAGLSVHMQVFKYINLSGLKYIHFFCSRIINAGFASIISFVILKLVPSTQEVFGSITSPLPKTFSVSFLSAVCMLIMGLSFILELDRNLRKC